MINIIQLINYLFSNNYTAFFTILNTHNFNNNLEIINLCEDIKYYYVFNDLTQTRIESIKLIKLIHSYNNTKTI
jgi:hypothetical protein